MHCSCYGVCQIRPNPTRNLAGFEENGRISDLPEPEPKSGATLIKFRRFVDTLGLSLYQNLSILYQGTQKTHFSFFSAARQTDRQNQRLRPTTRDRLGLAELTGEINRSTITKPTPALACYTIACYSTALVLIMTSLLI